ncbi:DUF5675 family protein [Flavobacterium humidisoli]|uniref:DUF5675 family protein n=1 Tax=Flavobacterium humidisoli TaxID=2937442 RepID=A0ABY4LL56_9FLAO|nr:DUF5675 family protein [Flavobacterium humidisoli]UPZ13838.1 DUF5675 family protein [Flavobacterium humidisoli]
MSDFKIIGNTDPVVGKEEFYSVNTFLPSILPFQNTASNNSFEQPVKWEIYILENGRWRKTKENDKTGKRVSYTFLQKSLERKGIRILARRGEDVARLNIKTHPAETPKIESIELLDKAGKKPTAPLSYGQTLKARVHCLHMEKRKVSVTLWEDDAAGAGHNKANEKNILQTLSGIVKDGKADVDFVLRPSFAKIADKSKDEGKIHEYYVTTDFDNEKLASKNVNVNDLETPVAPVKKKIPLQQPAQTKPPLQQPKANTPVTNGTGKAKSEITKVHITDAAGRPIVGLFKEKQIKVWIDSVGLIGNQIRFRLYEHDVISNDILIDQKFTITSNIFPVDVFLNRILKSKGDDIGEGAEQELFADVEVVTDPKQSKHSGKIDVDAKVFKPDPVDVTNKVAKVGEGDKNDKEDKGNVVCQKCIDPVTVKQLQDLFPKADKETLKTIAETYTKHMKALKMNTCWNKAHFFAQAMVESGKSFKLKEGEGMNYLADDLYLGRWNPKKKKYVTIFSYFKTRKEEAYKYGRIEEIKNGKKIITQVADQKAIANRVYANRVGNKGIESGDGWNFRGKGCIQLTGRTNYENANKYTLKYENADILKNSDLVAKDIKIAVLSSMAYFDMYGVNKKANKCKDVKNKIAPMIGNDVQLQDGKTNHGEKQEAFDDFTSKTFTISNCKYGSSENKEEKKETGKGVTIRLVRKWQTKKSTIGEFTIDDSDIKGYILEEKGPDTTVSGIEQRVPVGTYNLKWHNGTKKKGVLKLYNSDVSESRAILIHSGNTAADTEGCLLPGSSKSTDFVGGSQAKVKEINDYVKEKGVEGAKIIITAKYE